MRTGRAVLSIAVVLLGLQPTSGQSFVNLDFENTTVTGNYSASITGWGNTVPFNTIALDAPAVTVQGTNSPFFPAIQGLYSVLLQGGTVFGGPMNGTNGASVFQTGQIPIGAQSLTYWGGSGLQVTFDGHSLTPTAIGGAANYTVWSADISAYAGQTGELRFTEPWLNTSILDNIQFSTIPEPSVFALVSVFLFCLFGITKRPKRHMQANPAMISWFHAERQCRGVADLRRQAHLKEM